jgi:hypothetical protein
MPGTKEKKPSARHKAVSWLSERFAAPHSGFVELFHEERIFMFKRRSLMVGSLVTVTTSSLTRIASAQAGRPMLVFVGHEL